MDQIALLGSNLISPPIIAFATGLAAVWAKSDLKFPAQIYQGLTIYLLISIGYKGGSSLAVTGMGPLMLPLGATLFIGSAIPVTVFFITRTFLKFNSPDSAAMAAHYGSVSAVTFMVCLAFLDHLKVGYEAFMPAVMAAMEIPAIFVALLLAKTQTKRDPIPFHKAFREILTGKSLILLGCGLAAGIVAGTDGRARLDPFLVAPFYGALMLFLLEMGLVAGEKLKDAREAGWPLILFAIVAPVVQGAFGLLLGYAIQLSQGGAVVFAVLAASASYIAAPAAVRVALPQANPGYYVTASLGITFPFNLTLGIPLLYGLSFLLY